MDETKLNEFVGRMLGDLGGAFSIPMVRIGDRLGTVSDVCRRVARRRQRNWQGRAGIAERYAREWLSHQAASGYLDYDAAAGAFTLSPEQAMVFAQTDSPVYLQGAFDLAAVMLENQALVEPAFRTGQGGRLGRAVAVPVLHRRALLPSELSHRSRAVLATGSGRRDGEAGARRDRGRRRLRARLLDRDHGQGVPALDLRRLRLPRWLDRAGACACRAA